MCNSFNLCVACDSRSTGEFLSLIFFKKIYLLRMQFVFIKVLLIDLKVFIIYDDYIMRK